MLDDLHDYILFNVLAIGLVSVVGFIGLSL